MLNNWPNFFDKIKISQTKIKKQDGLISYKKLEEGGGWLGEGVCV